MESLLFKLTDYQSKILTAILENPDHVPGDFYFDFPSIDGYIEMFLEAKLISMNKSHKLSITELGRSHLVEYRLQKEIDEKREADLRFSKRCSIFSMIISALSLVVAIASVVVNWIK